MIGGEETMIEFRNLILKYKFRCGRGNVLYPPSPTNQKQKKEK